MINSPIPGPLPVADYWPTKKPMNIDNQLKEICFNKIAPN